MNVIPFKGDGQAALLKLYLDLLNAALDETTASTLPQALAKRLTFRRGEPHEIQNSSFRVCATTLLAFTQLAAAQGHPAEPVPLYPFPEAS